MLMAGVGGGRGLMYTGDFFEGGGGTGGGGWTDLGTENEIN